MENPRPQKVAVVTEVRERLDAAEAAILTEYRGLTVAELAALRTALRAVGCDYKVYKNTLVKLAVSGNQHEELGSLLSGPTAITFVSGEVSAAAKALRDFARTYPNLVVKGGLHPEGFLSTGDLQTLADLPSRDVLLARLAGAIAAPLQQLAGLLQALPRNLAYGLSALLDEKARRGPRRRHAGQPLPRRQPLPPRPTQLKVPSLRPLPPKPTRPRSQPPRLRARGSAPEAPTEAEGCPAAETDSEAESAPAPKPARRTPPKPRLRHPKPPNRTRPPLRRPSPPSAEPCRRPRRCTKKAEDPTPTPARSFGGRPEGDRIHRSDHLFEKNAQGSRVSENG